MTSPVHLDHYYNCEVLSANNEAFLIDALRLYNEDLHHWDGWICYAGVDSIRIDAELNVYNAVCKQKLLANLSHIANTNTSLELPTAPTKCNKPTCSGCSTDLQLTKFDPDYITSD
jgi:hypothetical protein